MRESPEFSDTDDLNVRRLLRSPLSRRIAIAVFAAIVAIEIAVMIPGYLHREAESLGNREAFALNALTTLLALYGAPIHAKDRTIDNDSPAFARNVLAAINGKGMAIINADGDVLYTVGDAPEIEHIPSPDDHVRRNRSRDGRYYDVVWPAGQNGFPWAIALRLDTSDVDRSLSSYVIHDIGWMLLIPAIITAATMLVLWPTILRPIVLLTAEQSRLANNPDRFTGTAPTGILHRKDEMGELYRAFQAMREQISESIANVNRAKVELEHQAAERTAELEALNKELTNQIAVSQKAGNRFRTFAESAADWYWEMDADLRFSYFSERFEEFSGLPPQTLLGKTLQEAGTQGFDSSIWEKHLATIENHEPFRNLIHPRVKNGETIWVSVNGIPMFDDNGRFQGYLGTGSDITKQKMIEQLLKQSTETMREAMEASHAAEQQLLTAIGALDDGFILFDADDRLVLCNDKYKEFYAGSKEVIVPGNKFEDIIRFGVESGQLPEAIGRIDEWVAERMAVHRSESWVGEQKMADGRWLKLTERKTPDGGTVGYRVDITELKNTQEALYRAKEAAEAANLAKSQFLAAMSHEIRTPLACVTGMADLLLDSTLTSRQGEWVRIIRSSSEDLLKILSQILDQSKLEAGKLELDPVDFHLPTLIYDTTQLFAPQIAEKGLDFEVNVSDSLPTAVHADRLRIGQIFANLLSNACKFTETGGIAVNVEGEQREDACYLLRIEVTDSGIGMDEDTRSRLFSPFVQADSTTSRKYGGTGLGLSIAKQLVEMAGGEVGVASTAGIGSTFWFTMPCQPARLPLTHTDNRSLPEKWVASRPLKLLLAEDNPVNQRLVAAIFEKLGHHIDVADHGMMALERLETGDYDLILMDIRMPVMDGLETTAIIRAMNHPKSDIPIIALTADIAAGNVKEYLNAGMNDVSAKPIDLAHLLTTINRLLGEDIHTPDPSCASPVKEIPAPLVEGPPLLAPLGIDFQQILERASEIADRQNENGPGDPTSRPDNEFIEADTFIELVARYEEGLVEECQELKAEFEGLAADPANDERRGTVKNLVHAMKGTGSSFGYPLVTKIATQADALLKQERALEEDDVTSLAHHIDALSLIASKKIFGDGGQAGSLLLRGLQGSYEVEQP